MDFGTAIDAMKDKRKVARKGWNWKGMFLYYVPAGAYAPCTDIAKSIVNEDGLVEYGAYIAMKTAQGNVVPWLASQTDMLAEDWMIVEQIKLIFDERETDEEVTDGIDKRQWMSGCNFSIYIRIGYFGCYQLCNRKFNYLVITFYFGKSANCSSEDKMDHCSYSYNRRMDV